MPRGLWRESDFLKLWTGQAVSQFGSRITRGALPLAAVLTLTATPLEMGALEFAGAAAVLAFGLFAGAWADRVRRRPIMIVADVGRFAILCSVPIAAALHRLSMTQLYMVAAAAGTFTVFFDVSYQAYLPSLVTRERLLEGNSKLALADSIAEAVGPGVGGVLVQLITAPMAILVDAFSFLASAVSLVVIRFEEPRPEPAQNRHLGREISEGLRECWRDPMLRALAGRTATAAFFGGIIGALYVLFTIRVLGLSPAVFGLIITVGGVSAMLGAFIAQPLLKHFGIGRTMIFASIAVALASGLMPLAHGSAALAASFLIAAQLGDVCWPVYTIAETSLRQAITPDRLLGRVNSAMHILFRGVIPLGAVSGGLLAQHVGIRNALFAASAGFLMSSLWLVFSPIRKLRALDALPAAARTVSEAASSPL